MSIKICLEVGHQAVKRAKITPEGYTHDWELFLRGAENVDISHYVEKVVFTLHESFPKPKRGLYGKSIRSFSSNFVSILVLKEPPYVVKEAGYAGFILPVTVYFRSKNEEPKSLEFKYDMDLAPQKVQKEDYVFSNPGDDFRRKLLKGGGIPLKQDLIPRPPEKTSEKKHKNKDDTFANLFGTPITKTSTKVSPDGKNVTKPGSGSKSQSSKSDKGSSSTGKDKEKHKNKHSSTAKDRDPSKDSRKHEEKHEKKDEKRKDKSHSKEKGSKEKLPKKPRSPSPVKKAPSPTRKPIIESTKKVEPEKSTLSTSSSSGAKKSSKKEKKTDKDREKKEQKRSEEKKIEVKPKEKEKESSKEVLKEKSKHEINKLEPVAPMQPDKKVEKVDGADRKHKHKKKEKAKDQHKDRDSKEKRTKKETNVKGSPRPPKDDLAVASASPAKKRPESRKSDAPVQQPPQQISQPPQPADTSDSDDDSSSSSSKSDSDTSTPAKPESSPSPQPPVATQQRPQKRSHEKIADKQSE